MYYLQIQYNNVKNKSLLEKFMSRKGLYTGFWIITLFMVTMLIYYTANLQKEVKLFKSTWDTSMPACAMPSPRRVAPTGRPGCSK